MVVGSDDNAVCLQLSELLDQHFLTDTRQHPPQFAKAAALPVQVEEHERFPFPANHRQRDIEPTDAILSH